MPPPIKLIKETDLQSKCREAITDLGGHCIKMSNRFLIGVPDLYCQLPGQMTSFWEVKSTNSMHWERQATPLTPNQKIWLRKHAEAGGFGGVIHFVMLNDLHVTIRTTTSFPYREPKSPWFIFKADLVPLPRGSKFQGFKDLIVRIHQEQAPRLIIEEPRTGILES